ncbi:MULTISPECIES: hypothetical protein [Dethiosulfovibrio]|uniref:Uncharacterized protein n=2 Tax=Dethiosulfovibrio TaxID=47054 RepID=A0ABS9EUX7_9BACT|nr:MULTISPECIES: hypothetical protein [Dethiosulfovibrio]MCF4143600.1 hypothetical protein [Dethiosulfovibrio marinus]MCF4146071.1 hypothetical protein [Dethiosulfovibrio acidaminovorans]
MLPELYNRDPDEVVACRAPWPKNEWGMGCSRRPNGCRECRYAVTRAMMEEEKRPKI